MCEQPVAKTTFSASDIDFNVIREPDGSLKWHGLYRGQKVKTALPIEQGEKCILLLDEADYSKNLIYNLLCIDRAGSVIWTAPLPSCPDSFVQIKLGGDSLHAQSWSGYRLVLDLQSGKVLSEVFIK